MAFIELHLLYILSSGLIFFDMDSNNINNDQSECPSRPRSDSGPGKKFEFCVGETFDCVCRECTSGEPSFPDSNTPNTLVLSPEAAPQTIVEMNTQDKIEINPGSFDAMAGSDLSADAIESAACIAGPSPRFQGGENFVSTKRQEETIKRSFSHMLNPKHFLFCEFLKKKSSEYIMDISNDVINVINKPSCIKKIQRQITEDDYELDSCETSHSVVKVFYNNIRPIIERLVLRYSVSYCCFSQKAYEDLVSFFEFYEAEQAISDMFIPIPKVFGDRYVIPNQNALVDWSKIDKEKKRVGFRRPIKKFDPIRQVKYTPKFALNTQFAHLISLISDASGGLVSKYNQIIKNNPGYSNATLLDMCKLNESYAWPTDQDVTKKLGFNLKSWFEKRHNTRWTNVKLSPIKTTVHGSERNGFGHTIHELEYTEDNYWDTYLRQHYGINQHHPEFWHGKKMSCEATIECLCDLVCSALRIKTSLKDAYDMAMTWVYTVIDDGPSKSIKVVEKFAKLDPLAFMIFQWKVHSMGLSEDFCDRHSTLSSRCRNPKGQHSMGWKDRKLLFKILNDSNLARRKQNFVDNFYSIYDNPVKLMFTEIKQHMSAVETMCGFFGLHNSHDLDKLNLDHIIALSLKWIKFEAPEEKMMEPVDMPSSFMAGASSGSSDEIFSTVSQSHRDIAGDFNLGFIMDKLASLVDMTDKLDMQCINSLLRVDDTGSCEIVTLLRELLVSFKTLKDSRTQDLDDCVLKDVITNLVGVNTNTSSIASHMGNLAGITNAINEFQGMISSMLRPLLDTFNKHLSSFCGAQVAAMISNITSGMKSIELAVNIIILILWYNSKGLLKASFTLVILLRFGLCDLLAMGWQAFEDHYGLVSDFFPSVRSDNEEKGWGGDIVSRLSRILLGAINTRTLSILVCLALTTWIGRKTTLPKFDKVETKVFEICKNIHWVGAGFFGASRIVQYFFAGLETVVHFAGEVLFGPPDKDEMKRVLQCKQWITGVHVLSSPAGIAACRKDNKICVSALALAAEGDVIMTNIEMFPFDIRPVIHRTYTECQKMHNRLLSFSSNTPFRMCPFHIQFFGQTGVGKSHMIAQIVESLGNKFYNKTIVSDLTWPLIMSDDDRDGYRQQPIILADDIALVDDPKPIQFLCSVLSNTPLIFSQAELADKGQTCNSEFVLSTTNTPYPTITGMAHIKAYYRRRDILVEVRCDDRVYHEEKFSKDLFDEIYPGQNSFDYPHLEFIVYNPTKNEVVGDPLSMGEFLLMMFDKIDKHRINQASFTNPRSDARAKYLTDLHEYVGFLETFSDYYETASIARNVESARQSLPIPVTEEELADYPTPLPPSFWMNALNLNFLSENASNMTETDFTQPSTSGIESKSILLGRFTDPELFVALKDLENNHPLAAIDRGHSYIYMDRSQIDKLLEIYGPTSGDYDSSLPMVDVTYSEQHYGLQLGDSRTVKKFRIPYKFLKYLYRNEDLTRYHPMYRAHMGGQISKTVFVLSIPFNDSTISVWRDPDLSRFLHEFKDLPPHVYHVIYKKHVKPYLDSSPSRLALINVYKNTRCMLSKLTSHLTNPILRVIRWIGANVRTSVLTFVFSVAMYFAMRKVMCWMLGIKDKPEEKSYNITPAKSATAVVGLLGRVPNATETSDLNQNVVDKKTQISKNLRWAVNSLGHGFNILGVGNYCWIMNYHSVSHMFEDSTYSKSSITIYSVYDKNKIFEGPICVDNITRYNDSDLVMVHLPNFNSPPDITKEFMSETEDDIAIGSDVIICGINSSQSSDRRISDCIRAIETVYTGSHTQSVTSERSYTYTELICVTGSVIKGTSGSFVYVVDSTGKRNLLGIVVSGDCKNTYIVPCPKEWIDSTMSSFNSIVPPVPLEIEEKSLILSIDDVPEAGGVFESIARNPMLAQNVTAIIKPIVYVPSSTKIIRSPLAKTFNDNGYISFREPAILYQHDRRNIYAVHPLAYAVCKSYIDDMKCLPQKLLDDKVIPDISEFINLVTAPNRYSASPTSLFDAITGRRGYDGYKSIDLTTSAGYPWCVKTGARGKRNIISLTEDGDVDYVAPEFVKEFEEFDEMIRHNKTPTNVMFDFPKDELQSVSKLAGVKTRSITVANLSLTLLYRKYNLDFEAAMHICGSEGEIPYTPGINPDSMTWTKLWMRLNSVSRKAIDFDVRNWDGHMTPQMFECVTEIINRFYPNASVESKNARRVLATNAVFGYVACDNILYQKLRGMPSGFAGTTTYNTVAHWCVFYSFYLQLVPPKLQNYRNFRRLVVFYIYGDDIVFSIHESIMDTFNGESVSKKYQEYGWEVTMPGVELSRANELLRTGKEIEDCTFLKRGFKKSKSHPYVMARLDHEVINDLVCWVRNGPIPVSKQILENMDQALEFAWAHGRKYYDKLRDTMILAVSSSSHSYHVGLCATGNLFLLNYDDQTQLLLDRFYHIDPGDTNRNHPHLPDLTVYPTTTFDPLVLHVEEGISGNLCGIDTSVTT